MKVIHDVVQGTKEWAKLRSGIPTASSFDRIITPGGKPCKSETAMGYMYQLLAERMMGHPVTEFTSHWADRGAQMEESAVNYYELQVAEDTEKIGFVTNDAGTVGASPDRFVGDRGLLEIKCPKEATHVGYLLNKPVDEKYRCQVQGQLWICERDWADALSYHPEMPWALGRVNCDEEFINLLSKAVLGFSMELESRAEELAARGWIKATEDLPPDPECITEEDLAAVLANYDERTDQK